MVRVGPPSTAKVTEPIFFGIPGHSHDVVAGEHAGPLLNEPVKSVSLLTIAVHVLPLFTLDVM